MRIRTYVESGALALAFSGLLAGHAAAQETVLRISHTSAEIINQGSHAWAVVFKEIVEAQSGDEIEVRILGANAAGSEREQIEKAQTGINQITLNSEILMPSFFPPARVLGIPFLFRSDAVAWEVLDGEFGEKFEQEWQDATGLRVLGVFNAGFRSLLNNERPIKSPADLKGLKIRTGENVAHIAMVRELGGSPVPIAWPEVYTSLQQGVVDGMENPPGLAYAMKFHEHLDYLTLNRHLFSIHAAMMNEAAYQALTDEQRAIVHEAARTATIVARATVLLDERNALGSLAEAGVEIYNPTAVEYAQFRDMGRPNVEVMVREDIGDEWVDALLLAIDEAEAAVSRP